MEEINIIDRDVMEVIRRKYDDIFPAEKKAADFVLENPTEAVNYNVSGLAKASGVSDATIIRMCHHLGYSGYYQFRLALSRELGKKQSRDPAQKEPGNVLHAVFAEYAATVAAIGRNMDVGILWNCVELLKTAGTVHIISMGNTTNVSGYLGFRLERLGVRCTYSDLPEYFINHIALADPSDIVLAITKSGSSKRVIDAMKLAKEKKLKMIVITAYEHSPASELADYRLDSRGTSTAGTGDFHKEYSYLNEFVIVETLINLIANEEWIRNQQADRLEMLLAENKL